MLFSSLIGKVGMIVVTRVLLLNRLVSGTLRVAGLLLLTFLVSSAWWPVSFFGFRILGGIFLLGLVDHLFGAGLGDRDVTLDLGSESRLTETHTELC